MATATPTEQQQKQQLQAMAGGGGGGEVQLLGFLASPFVIRVKVALCAKGVGYEYVELDEGNKSELLLRFNPVHKQVPVLVHDGRPVCESLAILQYVEEAWAGTGPSLLPSDPHDRATARFWAAYIDDKFFSSWIEILKANTEEARIDAIKNSMAHLDILEEAFKGCSKGKPFFSGDDAVGYVDVVLGSFLSWLTAVHEITGVKLLDEAKFPLLAAWAGRYSEAATVKKAMPDAEKIVEHAKALHAKWTAPTTN